MKSTIRTLVFGLGMASLGMVGGAGLTAIASPGGPGGPGAHGPRAGLHMPGMKLVHGIARLDDLTEAQEDMLEDLRADMKAEMKAMHGERKGEGKAMRDAVLSEGTVDREALHAELDEKAAEKLELAHTFLDRVLDIRDTLSPEQLAELREMAAEHEARREQMEARRESGEVEGRRPRRR
jgi:Spy/CpxP family protein refolding chaperone